MVFSYFAVYNCRCLVLVFFIHLYRRCCLISEKNYIFVRMAEDEDNGRLYMGLDLAFDKDHRARAIEHGEVTIFMLFFE